MIKSKDFNFIKHNRLLINNLKKWLLCLVVLPLFSFAQHLDVKIEKSDYYSKQFAKFYSENKKDSIAFVLRLWEAETGMNEALFRANALYLVSEGKFPSHLTQFGLIDYATAWEIRYNLMFKNERDDFFLTHPEFFSYLPIGSDYDRFTIDASRRLLNRQTVGSLSHSFITLYAGDTKDFFKFIADGLHENDLLGAEYVEKCKALMKLPETHIELNMGAWIPQGNLMNIGNRPSLGVLVGRWYPKFKIDLAFDVRFFETNKSIDIALTDTIMLEVANFLGARAAIEGSFSILKVHPYALDIFLGAGYEWIEMVKSPQDRRGEVFDSPSLTAGLTYRYFFPNRANIGISLGYHMLWLDNPKGTPIDGNAFTVALQIGLVENPKKKVGLNRFGINYW
jgi:hypothetical protein